MRITASAFLVVFALAVVSVGQAGAAVLEACVNNGNGIMRFADATTLCHSNETRVQWNQVGPAGPQGPAGPAGTSAGGPPYVFVCTPINYPNAGSSTMSLYVFNGSAASANVAVNPLNSSGTNLAGAPIPVSPGTIPPGDPAPLYPGQSGASTVSLAAGNTLIYSWYTAQASLTDPTLALTLRITADQPIVAATNTAWSGFNVVPCTLLPH